MVIMDFQMSLFGGNPRGNDHHNTFSIDLKEEIIVVQVRKFVPTLIVVGIDSYDV